MPIISEPELELSMSNFNRYRSHSEGSHRNFHEPVQAVLCSLQGQRLVNVAKNPPRSDELLEHPEKDWNNKKSGASKGEAPAASTSKLPASQPPQEGEKNKKKELEETKFPKLQDSKNPKRFHGKFLQRGHDFDGIQGQRGTKNEETPFPKEVTLSPDVVNTLTETKNTIVPVKNIKKVSYLEYKLFYKMKKK
ncbi:hypothetical protein O181_033343 [Austropuccinia psidii MF-1]|uniref:Uncharacterized protein n=1 Tax=Austropuccinia psidii MF-1 TaxID=1389203 RepID=A0A9Q3H6D7_9BASI|nr:hypothetical protein [Austropuccinia psidii MF-1]